MIPEILVDSIIKRMKNMASVAVFEAWLDHSTKSKNMRNKCIQVVQRMKNRDLDKVKFLKGHKSVESCIRCIADFSRISARLFMDLPQLSIW